MKNNKEEKNKFAAVMYGLSEDFGGTISKDSLALRFTALKEYSIDQIFKAGTFLLKNRVQNFPAVPSTREIILTIEKISGKLESKTAASLECDKVFKNLKYFGCNCDTVFKDHITKYLMTQRWNFHQLGKMEEKDLKWFRRDFIEAYQDMDNQKIDVAQAAVNKEMIPVSKLKQLIKR